MRKSVQQVGLLIAIVGVAIAIGFVIALAHGPSGHSQPGSNIKQIPKQPPTRPPVTVVHKTAVPQPYITSCPQPPPQPGVVREAFPDHDPTYAFPSVAIGVSGGQGYYIFAGYVRSKPTQGVISVQPISLDPCKDFVSHIETPSSQASAAIPVWYTPSQDGVITLTAVSGDTVSYTTADGTAGHFDFVTKVFLP
jgi:hypothetical protein